MAENVDFLFKQAIDTIEDSTVAVDPNAPSCNAWRLRPSEEAAVLVERYLNPPPRWGKKIDLSLLFLGPEKCALIGRMLILNRTVTSLDLSMCDMQEEAAVNFFTCIKRNQCLKHLNVNGNNIGDKGAIAAAECICNLETLHMSCNNIHDNGAVAISSFLRMSNKIRSLNLRANRITAYGVYKLISSLEPIDDRMSASLQKTVTSLRGDLEAGDKYQILVPDGDVLQSNQSFSLSIEVHNETLHTLWISLNCDIPDELVKILETILAKRFPQPPKGISKKKKKKNLKK